MHSEDVYEGLSGHLHMYVQMLAPVRYTPLPSPASTLSIFEIIIFLG